MKSGISILALFAVLINPIIGQFGTLDSTFSEDGKVSSDFFKGWDAATGLALQSDGKIVVAGTVVIGTNTDFGMIRYTSNGSLDTTFGVQGKVATPIGNLDDHMTSMKIQPDGKILLAGTPQDSIGHFAVIKYLPDGDVDSTFGIDGIQTTSFDPFAYCTSIAIQADGKIVLAGHSGSQIVDFALARYHPDGSIDSSFGTFGKIITDIGWEAPNGANALVIQPDGKIVAGGFAQSYPVGDFCLIRYNVDGSLDSTFNMDGKVTTSISQFNDYLTALAIQADGKIIAAGLTNNGDPNFTNYDFALTRYNVDGSLDIDFGTSGKVITSFGTSDDGANSVAIQPDGRIIVLGQTSGYQDGDFALARYNSDGTLDESWGTGGKLTTAFSSTWDGGTDLVIQPDGKIVCVGSYSNNGNDLALVRYISGIKVGVANLYQTGDVIIYPNPAHDEINISAKEPINHGRVNIFNLTGELILSESFNGSHITIREKLVSGIYLIQMACREGILVKKIFIE